MKSAPRAAASFAFVAVLAAGADARAQANLRAAPIGGRTTALGGTGVVYGRDAAVAFINPATAVLADDRRLSFSANFYSLTFVNAPDWYTPGPVDRTRFGDVDVPDSAMTDFAFDALPSSLCLFFRIGDVPFLVGKTSADVRAREARLGFCFAALQQQAFNFAAEGVTGRRGDVVTRQAQTVTQAYTRYDAGPTYAMNVNDALSIGASLHLSLTTHRSLMTSATTTHRGGASPISSSFYAGSRGLSMQVVGVLGATYALGRQKVGIAFEPPSLHVLGIGRANASTHFEGAAVGSATSTLSADGSFASQSPMRIALGSGFERSWGLFEIDATYSHGVGSAWEVDLEGTRIDIRDGVADDRVVNIREAERTRGIVNFAAGSEINLTQALSVLVGASTDFSTVPNGNLGGTILNYYPQRTTRLAASAGLSSHGAGGELIVGTEVSVGYGERLAIDSYRLPPEVGTTSHRTYQVLFTIAGSTTLRAIKRAVEDVKEVVDPSSKAKN